VDEDGWLCPVGWVYRSASLGNGYEVLAEGSGSFIVTADKA
jgi:hypothetical protein